MITPRLIVSVIVIVVCLLATCSAVWIGTPEGTHVQQRVAGELQSVGAPLLDASQVPRMLALAVIAIEDERFYSEPGVDPIALVRAMSYDARYECWCQGGSTITEQLVKLIYLDGSDKGAEKVVDAVLALKVERVLDKAHILADYLSLIPTGPNLYGVSEAACAYFGRSLATLNLADYALLAGIGQSPNSYDPLTHPSAAVVRRSEVLTAMVSERYITRGQALTAQSKPPARLSEERCQALT